MKATQVPVLVNNATPTGHTLQGSGVDNLFVHNWSYVQNSVCVMISHVKTHAGLFSRTPLSTYLKNMQSLTNCKGFTTLPPSLHHNGVTQNTMITYSTCTSIITSKHGILMVLLCNISEKEYIAYPKYFQLWSNTEYNDLFNLLVILP
jgi:hypothetical protein